MRSIFALIAILITSACSGGIQVSKAYCDANMHRAVTNSEAVTRAIVPPLVATVTPPIVTNIMYNGDFPSKEYMRDYVRTNATASITVGNVASGSVASVVNVGTPVSAIFDFTLPMGAQGERGLPGPVTVDVTNTVTASAGSYASVTNVGNVSNVVLRFTIPRGDQGEVGPATISVGDTITGNAGTSANVTNVGTSANAILKFTIPKGDKGDRGNDGSATVTIGTTTTVDYDVGASVTNVGTSTASILNFKIPRGDRGYDGRIEGVNGVATTIPSSSNATVSITMSGVSTNRTINFAFGIPSGSASIYDMYDQNNYTNVYTLLVNINSSASGVVSNSYMITEPGLYIVSSDYANGAGYARLSGGGILVGSFNRSSYSSGVWTGYEYLKPFVPADDELPFPPVSSSPMKMSEEDEKYVVVRYKASDVYAPSGFSTSNTLRVYVKRYKY